ncbi:MAG: type II secretion system protein [Elusimicrobia bacterium]|nr:type II secretion system protein [Elusimicrobiota bacterium]
MKLTKNQTGFSLLEILITTIIVCLLMYYAVKVYYKSSTLDEKTKKELSEQSINSNNYPGMVKDSKSKIEDSNNNTKKQEEQIKQIE